MTPVLGCRSHRTLLTVGQRSDENDQHAEWLPTFHRLSDPGRRACCRLMSHRVVEPGRTSDDRGRGIDVEDHDEPYAKRVCVSPVLTSTAVTASPLADQSFDVLEVSVWVGLEDLTREGDVPGNV